MSCAEYSVRSMPITVAADPAAVPASSGRIAPRSTYCAAVAPWPAATTRIARLRCVMSETAETSRSLAPASLCVVASASCSTITGTSRMPWSDSRWSMQRRMAGTSAMTRAACRGDLRPGGLRRRRRRLGGTGGEGGDRQQAQRPRGAGDETLRPGNGPGHGLAPSIGWRTSRSGPRPAPSGPHLLLRPGRIRFNPCAVPELQAASRGRRPVGTRGCHAGASCDRLLRQWRRQSYRHGLDARGAFTARTACRLDRAGGGLAPQTGELPC